MADTDWDLIASYAGLLCLASVSIYCGAFDSLPVRRFFTVPPFIEPRWFEPQVILKPSPRDRNTNKSLLQDEDEDEDEDEDIPDRVSSGDAWLFPIVSGPHIYVRWRDKKKPLLTSNPPVQIRSAL